MTIEEVRKKYPNTWITERHDADDVSVYYLLSLEDAITYFSFYTEDEDPPLVGYRRIPKSAVDYNPKVLKTSNKLHPLNHVSQDALNHGMVISIFEEHGRAV